MLVAVYGTLKRGKSNHSKLKDAKYLGPVNIPKGYRLRVGDLPYLVEHTEGSGCLAELYEVSESLLSELDRFEGHPSFYTRTLITVSTLHSKTQAYVYLYKGTPRGYVGYDY